MAARAIVVAPASAVGLEVPRGWRLRIVTPEGCQVADLVAFARADLRERFSQARTRTYLQRVDLRVGDGLRSTRERILMTLVEDSVGVHDLLFSGCCSHVYDAFLGRPGKTGCLDHLAAALAPWGIEADAIEAPLDLFMATAVRADGSLAIERSPARPGDSVVLRAESDVVVAVAACADDVTECNGGSCGPLAIELAPPAGAAKEEQ
jgi:uncharacterized protein YcgI (DUF1989 family)